MIARPARTDVLEAGVLRLPADPTERVHRTNGIGIGFIGPPQWTGHHARLDELETLEETGDLLGRIPGAGCWSGEDEASVTAESLRRSVVYVVIAHDSRTTPRPGPDH
jgi:hypothetical protein